jgi:hypothetical protein
MLNSNYPGHVYLTAHSHGNVVAGEALRLAGANQVVNTYVAMQAAVDSHTYDPATPIRPVSLSTPDRYGHYYTNGAPSYFNSMGGAGTFVNFFNANDWALNVTWLPDQNLKPDLGYLYRAVDDTFWVVGWLNSPQLVFPQDTYTIFSYCDQAHAFALGAQRDVGGVFAAGSQTDLQSVWPDDMSQPDPAKKYSAHLWHSAEFRSDNPSRAGFWNAVLGPNGFNLK